MKKTIMCALIAINLAACATPTDEPQVESTPSPPAEENRPLDKTDFTNGTMLILGELVHERPSVSGDEGVILIPLFTVAEKLGIEAVWDEEDKCVLIENNVRIWIGKDYYTKDESEPIRFGPPPILTEEILYVPIYFFDNVVGGYESYVSEDGTVIINKSE